MWLVPRPVRARRERRQSRKALAEAHKHSSFARAAYLPVVVGPPIAGPVMSSGDLEKIAIEKDAVRAAHARLTTRRPIRKH